MKRNKAQSISEYAVLLVIIVSVMAGMQLYVQRTLQARYHEAVAQVGRDLRNAVGNNELPLQYEPYYQRSETDRSDTQNSAALTLRDGSQEATLSGESQRSGWEYTNALGEAP